MRLLVGNMLPLTLNIGSPNYTRLPARYLAAVVNSGCHGMVLEGFGPGNVPSAVIPFFQEAKKEISSDHLESVPQWYYTDEIIRGRTTGT